MKKDDIHLAAQRAYSVTIGRGAIAVAVTGTSENAGSDNLARTMAETGAGFGKRVLLLTANGLEPGGDIGASAEAIAAMARPLGNRLWTLDIARGSAFHACANDNKRLVDVFAALASMYDAIILDSPPYGRENPVIYTPLTAAAFDAVILVAEPGVHPRQEFDAICSWLSESGGIISAIVLNDNRNPTLSHEIVREARRLERIWPALPRFMERTIAAWPPLCRHH